MPGWKGIVGTSFTPDEFDNYCHTLQWNAWRPSFIVLHNTATPSLAQRPNGLTKQHLQNLESFYRWSPGTPGSISFSRAPNTAWRISH
jgi:hypothetical protein